MTIDDYHEKIYRFLITGYIGDKLLFPLDQEVYISEYVDDSNIGDFYLIVREFISLHFDWCNGFNLLFSDDYTKLKKTALATDVPYCKWKSLKEI